MLLIVIPIFKDIFVLNFVENDAKTLIKALQSCSTWNQDLKKNSDSGSRSIDCISVFKNCITNANLEIMPRHMKSNSSDVPETEDEIDYDPLYFDIRSFNTKFLRKILMKYIHLDVSDSESNNQT